MLSFEEAQRVASRLRDELGRRIVGQQAVVEEILTVFVAGGHCLLRGVPGLAKTLLIKTLAQAVHLKFNRIQFTPDLMPSDIIGTEGIEEDRATGRRDIRFIPGPVFANVIVADEINRTPPKTQAALLEAMQEYQVTVNGVRHALERPLFVLATQIPIAQEGTYPLPQVAAKVWREPGSAAARVEPRPMRSVWWLLPFVRCLSGGWWLRRQRGAR